MTKYKTIIVDDHKIFQDYLCNVLNEIENVEIYAQVANGLELLNVISSRETDLVFMEINCSMINSIVIVKRLLKRYPHTKIIATSLFREDEKNHYSTLLNLGIHGFILKQTCKNDVEKAISTVMKGGTYFSNNFQFKPIVSQT
jgi:DNA-binding NarL/FixJ family response regulator